MDHFARLLAAQGAVVYFVHYFDRTGTIFAGDRSIDANSLAWTETARDAVDFAAAHPRTRKDTIGLFGYSLGAFLAVAEASRDPRVVAVVEISGGIFKGFAPRMRRVPPMLILHGRMDQRVPVARAFELEKKATRLGSTPAIKIYEGEGHVLSPDAANDATRRALAFFAKHWKSAPDAMRL